MVRSDFDFVESPPKILIPSHASSFNKHYQCNMKKYNISPTFFKICSKNRKNIDKNKMGVRFVDKIRFVDKKRIAKEKEKLLKTGSCEWRKYYFGEKETHLQEEKKYAIKNCILKVNFESF